jgi:CDP-4-dehydro-6-deoxyglucose reductase
MTYTVTIKPSGNTFSASENESIIDAAARAGFTLPYGCRNGTCASCKGKVLEGTVDHGSPQGSALVDFEKKAGLTLFCQASARSDLIIEAREIATSGDIEVRRLPSRVQSIDHVADDVAVLRLKLPSNEQLQFFAGQYVDILLRDGKRRSYSMANPPHDNQHIELHVRNMENGTFTAQVFGSMKEKDILRIEGPLGTFFLREDSDKPIIFVASGTGFAPIKSIIEHIIEKKIERPISLYWGGRRPKDIYAQELAEKWANTVAHFKFIPVVSDATADDVWSGRTGLVHIAAMQDFPDMSGHEVYSCGVPAMVEAAHNDFTSKCGRPEDAFFSDACTPSVDPK